MLTHLQRFLAVIFYVFACGILSAQTVSINGLRYSVNIDNKEARISGAEAKECPDNIVIPESIPYEGQNYPVVGINSYAFEVCSYNTNIVSISLPSSITSLGDGKSGTTYAFYGLSKIVSIDVSPENKVYSSIDGVLFNKSKTTLLCYPFGKAGDYNVPSGVTAIGDNAFNMCKELTSISIPNTVESIGYCAISGCPKLNTITIPASVKTLDKGALDFNGDLYVEINSVEDWINHSINQNLGGKRHLIKNGAELTAIEIPNSISSIGYGTFQYCIGIESVKMPNTITNIGNYAFYECSNLTSIELSNSVTQIGTCTFYGCKNLKQLNLPNSLTNIGNNAFAGCTSVTELTIPNTVTIIDNSAFRECTGLTTITIPNSVSTISSSAFAYCTGLTDITLPNSLTSINSSVFSGCTGLTSLSIPNSVTSIASSAFQDCSGIVTLTLPNSLKSIGSDAFKGCSSLTSIVIPSMVTSIEDYAFQNCSALTTVELPEKLTTIKKYAFDGCKNLVSMHLPSGITTLGEKFVSHCKDLYAPFNKIVKTNISMKGKLHVPTGASQTFSSNGWNASSIIEDIDMDFLIASGTYGSVVWQLVGNTLTLGPTYNTATMTSSYTTYGTIEYQKYPWYEYRYKVKHVVIKGLRSIGEACLQGMDHLETLTTNTAVVSLYKNATTDELFTCFGKSYLKEVYEYYSNGSIKVKLYKFLIPSTLSKVVYTGEAFNMNYFSGGVVTSYETKTEEFHPTKPFEIIATNVTSVSAPGTKSLKNTKVYLTYTGNLTSGLFRDMGDLYSLTLNGTGVATEGGAFYTLFGSAPYNMDMMYGGGGYYIPLNLKEVHIMEGVTSIPEACFNNVTSLEKVYLPSTLRGVQNAAFRNCDGLTDIYVNAALPPSAKDDSFDGVNIFLCTLHVPYDSKQYYSIAKGWKDFFTIDNDADIRLTIVKNIENAGQIIGSTSYMNGEMTDITAVANSGYKFVEWTDEDGNTITTNAKLSVEAKKSCTYYAVFAPYANNGSVTGKSSGNSITLAWTNVDGVLCYKVIIYSDPEMTIVQKEIYVDANGNIITRAQTSSGMTVTISELNPSTLYYYKIVGLGENDKVLEEFVGSIMTGVNNADFVLGDANGDDMVTVADLAMTASYILGTESEGLAFKAADVNGDGTISVADLASMAYYILNGEWPSATQVRAFMRRHSMWQGMDE